MSTNKMQDKPADTPVTTENGAIIPCAEIASTTEWMNQVAIINRKAGDLVDLDVVQQGYMAHGHPASMGFIHLNKMTSSRMRKKFPFYDRNDPCFAMLEARVEHAVGQGILKKYEARKSGEYIDYLKWIDREVDKIFEEFKNWMPHYKELEHGEKDA